MSIEILEEKYVNDYILLLSELTHVGKIENITSIFEEINDEFVSVVASSSPQSELEEIKMSTDVINRLAECV